MPSYLKYFWTLLLLWWYWRSDSCSNRLLYYKDPHLSLATGILYNFHTAFAIMVKHSCLCLVTWNNSGHNTLLWWSWRSDSCSNRLLYYKDPHLSLTYLRCLPDALYGGPGGRLSRKCSHSSSSHVPSIIPVPSTRRVSFQCRHSSFQCRRCPVPCRVIRSCWC